VQLFSVAEQQPSPQLLGQSPGQLQKVSVDEQ
jgi:hypothetical protein